MAFGPAGMASWVVMAITKTPQQQGNAPMTDHVGLPVLGYKTTQPHDLIATVNNGKILEERVLRHLDALVAEGIHDGRNLALARTHLEDAFYRLTRGIFKPGRIALPEDAL